MKMKTITFYSYKGGVGRSLALVNIATRLSEFGKKVCVIDFDLEAPGLHLKFPVSKSVLNKDYEGIVDYVYKFANEGFFEGNIKKYSFEINVTNNGKPLTLIPAGNTNSTEYWKKLSNINWYDLIYENKNGLAFFLNLKEIIKSEIKPDFLLIDSRTGISEMSGISLSLLADEVVIVAANNKENLSGANKIIKSLNNEQNNILGNIPKINFVLSRIPFTDKPEDRAKENLLINRIKREYLLPYVEDVNVIHSDRELEELEKVKIAYEKDETNTQISIDYLKLFEILTKNDLSEIEVIRFKNIRQSERFVHLSNNTTNIYQKLDYINKAIDLNELNSDLYVHRANIHFTQKDFSECIVDVEKAIKLNENNIPAVYLKIDALIESDKVSEANTILDENLELRPIDITLLIKKIILLSRKGSYEEAEKICSKVIELYPEYSGGYSCRGNVRRLMKQFDLALEDTYKALELDSENIQGIATLAEIFGELNKLNDFFIHFENAIKLNSGVMQNVINAEEIYYSFKNNDRFNQLLIKYGLYFHK